MPARLLALLLTLLTGFSGLVYEVAWEKYLATLLGSHSEATCAVLGVFLGGLSLGYAIFGRVARRLAAGAPKRGGRAGLLLAYGVVEGSIGLYALAFRANRSRAETPAGADQSVPGYGDRQCSVRGVDSDPGPWLRSGRCSRMWCRIDQRLRGSPRRGPPR